MVDFKNPMEDRIISMKDSHGIAKNHRKKFQSDYDVLVCFPVNAIVLLKIFN